MSAKIKPLITKQSKSPVKRANNRRHVYTSDWLAFLASLSFWLIALAMLAVTGLLAPGVAPQLFQLLRGALGLP